MNAAPLFLTFVCVIISYMKLLLFNYFISICILYMYTLTVAIFIDDIKNTKD